MNRLQLYNTKKINHIAYLLWSKKHRVTAV